jgi:tRNA (guanine9-N1)-methyltransferase
MVYGLNRKSKRPLELHFVGTGDPHVAPLFLKHSGYANWKLFKQEKVDEFPGSPQDCVYLSPESPNLLEEIDESKVYIIGGISDNQNDMKVRHRPTLYLSRNNLLLLLFFPSRQGATLLKAAQLGFNHARLPLKEHAPWLTTRGTILNINHCYNILLLKAAGMPWAEAIDISVPTRESFRGESN